MNKILINNKGYINRFLLDFSLTSGLFNFHHSFDRMDVKIKVDGNFILEVEIFNKNGRIYSIFNSSTIHGFDINPIDKIATCSNVIVEFGDYFEIVKVLICV